LICHRFIKRVKREEGYFINTQADASCLSEPEAIREEMFLGKVIGIMHNKRVVNLEWVGQRYINILIIIFTPLLCAVFKVYYLLRRKK